MTAEDRFFAALENTPRDWRIEAGRIRRSGAEGEQSPLTSLNDMPAQAWEHCARQVGLSHGLASNIVRAAAGYSELPADLQQLRQRLLRACGLEEEKNETN